MPEATARFAAIVLAAILAWAATSKLLSFARWNVTLNGYGLPRVVRAIAAPGVPMLELLIAAGLVVAPRAGAAGALALLGAFCLAILRARAVSGDKLPCGCFGGSNERDYRTMLWRNSALVLLAAVVLGADEPVSIGMPAAPGKGELLPVILIVTGGLLALWTALRVSAALRHKEHP